MGLLLVSAASRFRLLSSWSLNCERPASEGGLGKTLKNQVAAHRVGAPTEHPMPKRPRKYGWMHDLSYQAELNWGAPPSNSRAKAGCGRATPAGRPMLSFRKRSSAPRPERDVIAETGRPADGKAQARPA